jgi:O-antigen/teichoic acid export membrane protein
VDRRGIAKEVASNYAIQGSNILIPLMALGIGASSGDQVFEIIASSLAFSTWGTLLSDYGYSTLGVQRAARSKSINSFRRRLSAGLLIKGLLAVTYAVFAIFVVRKISDISDVTSLSLFQFAGVITAITPLWFLQGKKLLSKIFVVFVASRLLLLILFSLFAVFPERFLDVPFDYIAGISILGVNFLICISVFRFLVLEEGFSPLSPKYRDIRRNLKVGYHLVATSVLTTGYTVAVAPIISIVVSPSIGAYFFTAERIVQALKSVSIPALISTLPYLANIKSSDSSERRWFMRTAIAIFIASSLLVVILWLVVNTTVRILTFDIGEEVFEIFQILVLSFPFVLVSFFLGTNLVLNTKGPKVYFYSYAWTFSAFFSTLPILVHYQGIHGIAVGSLMAEVMIATIFATLSIRYVRRNV